MIISPKHQDPWSLWLLLPRASTLARAMEAQWAFWASSKYLLYFTIMFLCG